MASARFRHLLLGAAGFLALVMSGGVDPSALAIDLRQLGAACGARDGPGPHRHAGHPPSLRAVQAHGASWRPPAGLRSGSLRRRQPVFRRRDRGRRVRGIAGLPDMGAARYPAPWRVRYRVFGLGSDPSVQGAGSGLPSAVRLCRVTGRGPCRRWSVPEHPSGWCRDSALLNGRGARHRGPSGVECCPGGADGPALDRCRWLQ